VLAIDTRRASPAAAFEVRSERPSAKPATPSERTSSAPSRSSVRVGRSVFMACGIRARRSYTRAGRSAARRHADLRGRRPRSPVRSPPSVRPAVRFDDPPGSLRPCPRRRTDRSDSRRRRRATRGRPPRAEPLLVWGRAAAPEGQRSLQCCVPQMDHPMPGKSGDPVDQSLDLSAPSTVRPIVTGWLASNDARPASEPGSCARPSWRRIVI
jgi:hypothetical protein